MNNTGLLIVLGMAIFGAIIIGWIMSPPIARNEWGRDLTPDFQRVP